MKYFSFILIFLSFNFVAFSYGHAQLNYFINTNASKEFLSSNNAQYVTSKTLKTEDFNDYLLRNKGKKGIKPVYSIIGLHQDGNIATIHFFYVNEWPAGNQFLEASSITFTRVEPDGLWVTNGDRPLHTLLWKKVK